MKTFNKAIEKCMCGNAGIEWSRAGNKLYIKAYRMSDSIKEVFYCVQPVVYLALEEEFN